MPTAYARLKLWRQRHRDTARLIDRTHRAMWRHLARNPAALMALQVAYGRQCLACRRRPAVCWDHVVPLPAGINQIGNLQPLCRHCNTGKRGLRSDYRADDGEAARRIGKRWPLVIREKRARLPGMVKPWCRYTPAQRAAFVQ